MNVEYEAALSCLKEAEELVQCHMDPFLDDEYAEIKLL